MLTIGKLAKQFGLSRSTLLYYDRQGLLSPSGRTQGNYRTYSDEDVRRLQAILRYRDAGVPLAEIQPLLDNARDSHQEEVLESHLQRLNDEIAQLRKQQQATLDLLGTRKLAAAGRSMTKEQWVQLLASTGLNEAEMMRWHREFERLMPQAHQDFLESLSIPQAEIASIRKRSREEG